MNKELLRKLVKEKGAWKRWKQSQVTYKDTKDAVYADMEGLLQVHQLLGRLGKMCTCCVAGDLVTKGKKKDQDIQCLCCPGPCWQDLPSGIPGIWCCGKVWTREDLPLVKEDQVKEHLNLAYTVKPCTLMGCIHEYKGAGCCHCQTIVSSLKCHDNWWRFLRTGRKHMSLLSSWQAGRRIWGTTGWSASPFNPWEGDEANLFKSQPEQLDSLLWFD